MSVLYKTSQSQYFTQDTKRFQTKNVEVSLYMQDVLTNDIKIRQLEEHYKGLMLELEKAKDRDTRSIMKTIVRKHPRATVSEKGSGAFVEKDYKKKIKNKNKDKDSLKIEMFFRQKRAELSKELERKIKEITHPTKINKDYENEQFEDIWNLSKSTLRGFYASQSGLQALHEYQDARIRNPKKKGWPLANIYENIFKSESAREYLYAQLNTNKNKESLFKKVNSEMISFLRQDGLTVSATKKIMKNPIVHEKENFSTAISGMKYFRNSQLMKKIKQEDSHFEKINDALRHRREFEPLIEGDLTPIVRKVKWPVVVPGLMDDEKFFHNFGAMYQIPPELTTITTYEVPPEMITIKVGLTHREPIETMRFVRKMARLEGTPVDELLWKPLEVYDYNHKTLFKAAEQGVKPKSKIKMMKQNGVKFDTKHEVALSNLAKEDSKANVKAKKNLALFLAQRDNIPLIDYKGFDINPVDEIKVQEIKIHKKKSIHKVRTESGDSDDEREYTASNFEKSMLGSIIIWRDIMHSKNAFMEAILHPIKSIQKQVGKFAADAVQFCIALSCFVYQINTARSRKELYVDLIAFLNGTTFPMAEYLTGPLEKLISVICSSITKKKKVGIDFTDEYGTKDRTYGHIKTEDGDETPKLGDFTGLSWFQGLFESFISSPIVKAIQEFLVSILATHWLPGGISKAMYFIVGTKGGMTISDLLCRLLNAVVKLYRMGQAYLNGVPINDILFGDDPVKDFTKQAEELLFYKDKLFTGVAPKAYPGEKPNRMEKKDYRFKLGKLIETGESLIKHLSKVDNRRVWLKKLVLDMRNSAFSIDEFYKTSQRTPPFCMMMHGTPDIGKSKLTPLFYHIWSAVVGREYSEDQVYVRCPTSDFWEAYVAYCHAFVFYAEMANESSELAKKGEDKRQTELQAIIDSNPYPCDMAFDGKGKTYFNSEFVMFDTNNIDMWFKEKCFSVSAMKRRIFYMTVVVHPDYRLPSGTGLDKKKSMKAFLENGSNLLDRYWFTGKSYSPNGNDLCNETVHFSNVSVFEMIPLMADIFRHHIDSNEKLKQSLDYSFVTPLVCPEMKFNEAHSPEPLPWAGNVDEVYDDALDLIENFEYQDIGLGEIHSESWWDNVSWKKQFEIDQEIYDKKRKEYNENKEDIDWSVGLTEEQVKMERPPIDEVYFDHELFRVRKYTGMPDILKQFLENYEEKRDLPMHVTPCTESIADQNRRFFNERFEVKKKGIFNRVVDRVGGYASLAGAYAGTFAKDRLTDTYIWWRGNHETTKNSAFGFATIVSAYTMPALVTGSLVSMWYTTPTIVDSLISSGVKSYASWTIDNKLTAISDRCKTILSKAKNPYSWGSVAAFGAAVATIIVIIKKFFPKKAVQSEGMFMNNSKFKPELDFIESKINLGQNRHRVKGKSDMVYNLSDVGNDTVFNGTCQELDAVMWKNRRFTRVDFGGEKETGLHFMGVSGQYALINEHVFGDSNVVTLTIFKEKDEWENKTCVGHKMVLKKDDCVRAGPDLLMFVCHSQRFRDFRIHFTDTPVKNSPGSFNRQNVRIKFENDILWLTDKKFKAGGFEMKERYHYNAAHGPGLCGTVLIAQFGKKSAIVGIHNCGANDSSDAYSVPITRSRINECITHLREISPVMSVFSEGAFDVEPWDRRKAHPPKSAFNYLHLEHLTSYGNTGQKITGIKKVSKVEKSPIADEMEAIILRHVKLPRTKDFSQPILKPCEYKGEYVNPINNGLEKMNVPYVDFDHGIARKIIDLLKDRFISGMEAAGTTELHPLSLQEAINGFDDYIGRMNMSTSGGYGFIGKKSEHFPIVQEDPLIRMPKDKFNAEYVRAHNAYYEEKCAMFINQGSLKDEPLPIEKCETGNTRIFYVCNAVSLVMGRQYLAPFISHMLELNELFCTTIGKNMYKSADELHEEMEQWSEIMMAGDYKKFDLTMPLFIRLIGSTVIYEVLKHFGYSEYALKMVMGILSDLLFPVFLLYEDIIMRNIILSGIFATAELNSLFGLIMMLYAWFSNPKLADLNPFDYLKPKIYGDDNVTAVKEAIAEFFNNETYAKQCKELFNMTYTDPDKGDKIRKFMKLDDVDYLKRKFVRSELFGRYVARLDINSIYKMVMWTIPSDSVNQEEQLIGTLNSFLMECFLYSESVDSYNSLRADVMSVYQNHFGRVLEEDEIHTYDRLCLSCEFH